MTIPPASREPTGWRAVARRLVARLRRGRGATKAAAFDTAERRAYEAALALWNVSLAPPTASSPLPAASPTMVPEPAAPAGPPVLPTPPSPPLELPIISAGELPGQDPSTASQRQPSDASPDSLLRTPSSVDSVADDFFESVVRRIEGDR